MNDWNCWLDSSETKAALKRLSEEVQESREYLTDGSHLTEKSVEKIALDFTYSSGVIDGLVHAIEILKNIEEEDDRD